MGNISYKADVDGSPALTVGDSAAIKNSRYKFAINALDEGIIIVDAELCVVAINDVLSRLIGISKEKILGRHYQKMIRLDLGNIDCLFRETLKQQKDIIHINGALQKSGGGFVPVTINTKVQFDSEDRFIGGVQIYKNMQKLDRLEDRNGSNSIWDDKSGLFSREHLFYLLELEFAKVRRYKQTLSVMLLDVDNFQELNKSYGREVADLALAQVGKLLQENIRLSDIAGRLKRDRFVLALPRIDKESARDVADRIRYLIEQMSLLTPLLKEEVHMTISIGVASYPNFKVMDWKDMLKAADIALYMAKEMGKNRTESF
ncbi:MAG: hypothetical protein B6244_01575 [Candidatus Cloacimonetes bacterium 4572_55]|nr:MAG: hypothetical protein B6244_01575 [Candidatus Cloacimonetes bacterium 4572_55]